LQQQIQPPTNTPAVNAQILQGVPVASTPPPPALRYSPYISSARLAVASQPGPAAAVRPPPGTPPREAERESLMTASTPTPGSAR
jgi:hypothetical protein